MDMGNDIRDRLKRINRSDTAQEGVNDRYDHIGVQLKEEELKKARLLNEALDGENKSDTQDRWQRKIFAVAVFLFVVLYMAAVLTVVFLQGSCDGFNLSDSIIITLLGTTTANVIAVLVIVVAYLFSRNRKH